MAAANVWALPEDGLERLVVDFAELQADEDAHPKARESAAYFRQACEQALAGIMPGALTMRRAGEALAQVPREEDE